MADRGSGNSEHANQENILKIGAASQTAVLEMLKSGNDQKLKLGIEHGEATESRPPNNV